MTRSSPARLLPAKPRRWFRPRFSLRTLFVLVTVLCLWLGWQVDVVRERKAMLQRVEELGGAWVSLHDYPARPRCIPWFRLLLDDQYVVTIYLPAHTLDNDCSSIEFAFPEARIVRFYNLLQIIG